MLQERQLAEDAVPGGGSEAWRKIQQLREGTEMRPWFLGIVATNAGPPARRWWSVLKIDAERRGA